MEKNRKYSNSKNIIIKLEQFRHLTANDNTINKFKITTVKIHEHLHTRAMCMGKEQFYILKIGCKNILCYYGGRNIKAAADNVCR
jgi:hypothetical protein